MRYERHIISKTELVNTRLKYVQKGKFSGYGQLLGKAINIKSCEGSSVNRMFAGCWQHAWHQMAAEWDVRGMAASAGEPGQDGGRDAGDVGRHGGEPGS